MKLHLEQAQTLAKTIALTVQEYHHGKPSWSKECGQYLVYGFERHFGFFAAIDMESRVERAFNSGRAVEPTILEFLLEFTERPQDTQPGDTRSGGKP